MFYFASNLQLPTHKLLCLYSATVQASTKTQSEISQGTYTTPSAHEFNAPFVEIADLRAPQDIWVANFHFECPLATKSNPLDFRMAMKDLYHGGAFSHMGFPCRSESIERPT